MTDHNCLTCGGILVGRQKKYCSSECQKSAGREAHLKSVYGIDRAEWEQIWEYQGKRCGICRREPKPGETFHTDHEHAQKQSGPIRGILCPYCNTRLVGRLKSHERAQQLADYLRDPPATKALGRVAWAPGRPPRKRQPRKKKR